VGDIVKGLVATGLVDFTIQSISFWNVGDGTSKTHLSVTLTGAANSEYVLDDWGNATSNAGARINIPVGKQVPYKHVNSSAATALAGITGPAEVVADFHLIWRPSAIA